MMGLVSVEPESLERGGLNRIDPLKDVHPMHILQPWGETDLHPRLPSLFVRVIPLFLLVRSCFKGRLTPV